MRHNEKQLFTHLLPHQTKGVEWMLHREVPLGRQAPGGSGDAPGTYVGGHGGGGVLGDDMGMGKTLQMLTLIAVQLEREHRDELSSSRSARKRKRCQNGGAQQLEPFGRGATLVVCPQSVLHAWSREAKQWLGWTSDDSASDPGRPLCVVYTKAQQLTARGGAVLQRSTLVVVSYETVDCDARGARMLQALSWRRVILDEAHRIRNAPKTCDCIYRLSAWSKWACTGTLFHNGVEDVGNVARFLGIFPYDRMHWWRKHRGDMSAIDAWRRRFYLARNKSILCLPPVRNEVVLCPMRPDTRSRYDHMLRSALRTYVDVNSRCATRKEQQSCLSIVLGTIRKMRQFCNHPILSQGRQAFEDFLDRAESGSASDVQELLSSKVGTVYRSVKHALSASPHNKAVVFSQWKGTLRALRILLAADGVACAEYVGSMPVDEKQSQIDAFQGGQHRVILVSLRAGGVGINLNTASHVLMVDGWYNPFLEAQAVDRVNRIGQQHAHVTCTRFHVPSTVEDDIVDIQQSKRDAARTFYTGVVGCAADQDQPRRPQHGGAASTEPSERCAADGGTKGSTNCATVRDILDDLCDDHVSAHKAFKRAHMKHRSERESAASLQQQSSHCCNAPPSLSPSPSRSLPSLLPPPPPPTPPHATTMVKDSERVEGQGTVRIQRVALTDVDRSARTRDSLMKFFTRSDVVDAAGELEEGCVLTIEAAPVRTQVTADTEDASTSIRLGESVDVVRCVEMRRGRAAAARHLSSACDSAVFACTDQDSGNRIRNDSQLISMGGYKTDSHPQHATAERKRRRV